MKILELKLKKDVLIVDLPQEVQNFKEVTKLKKMEDLFKKLGEITKPEKQGGFFDLPKDTRCKDKSHEPPTHIYIPQGKGYRHVCPSCGKVTDLIPPQISF